MRGKLIIALLLALCGAGLAQELLGIDIDIDDQGFNYYDVDYLDKPAYFRLEVGDEGLTVILSSEPFDGALVHHFAEIDGLADDTHRMIYGRTRPGESRTTQRQMLADERTRLHLLAGIGEHPSGVGWEVVHSDGDQGPLALSDVVESYLGWFAEAGLAVDTISDERNARIFEVSGSIGSLRVVFFDTGEGVSAYFRVLL